MFCQWPKDKKQNNFDVSFSEIIKFSFNLVMAMLSCRNPTHFVLLYFGIELLILISQFSIFFIYLRVKEKNFSKIELAAQCRLCNFDAFDAREKLYQKLTLTSRKTVKSALFLFFFFGGLIYFQRPPHFICLGRPL